jgi:hypothetical protein
VTPNEEPLTPEEETRRLLADARHTGPTPPDVVARLDRALDDLVQEPARTAPVVDLARRRRRVASLLVAAAAVVVVGIGIGEVINTQGGEADTASQESGAQPADGLGAAEGESKSGAQDGRTASGDAPAATSPLSDAEKAQLLDLRRDHLADDLADFLRLTPVTKQYRAQAGSADRAAGAICEADSWGTGRFVAVSYDGTPAVVVFRRPVGDTQVADVFLCGSEEPVRSVTLPAP